MAAARSASAMTSMSGVERARLAVERRQRLARRARAARRSPAPASRVEVEGVHRLPELEQHVVGDVDDVADRADAAARVSRACIHAGDGPTRDVGHRADVAPAQVRRSIDGRRRALGRRERRPPASAGVGRRPAQRQAVRRGDLARDADDRQAVGPVGRDVEVEHASSIARRPSRPARCPRARARAATAGVPIVLGRPARRRSRAATRAGPS